VTYALLAILASSAGAAWADGIPIRAIRWPPHIGDCVEWRLGDGPLEHVIVTSVVHSQIVLDAPFSLPESAGPCPAAASCKPGEACS
jgi:hypothetical protein